MADYIHMKELTVITSADDMNDERFVLTHKNTNGLSETCSVEEEALIGAIASSVANKIYLNRSIFGSTIPENTEGRNGDVYFRISDYPSTRIIGQYVKYEGKWYSYDYTRR